jgi:hypothetical protein
VRWLPTRCQFMPRPRALGSNFSPPNCCRNSLRALHRRSSKSVAIGPDGTPNGAAVRGVRVLHRLSVAALLAPVHRSAGTMTW